MKETLCPSEISQLLCATMALLGLVLQTQASLYLYPDMPVSAPTNQFPTQFSISAFEPPVDPGVWAKTNTPEISEWTRGNNPGDTMALTGENLSVYSDELRAGRDTQFVIYGEGMPVTDCFIQRLDGRQCAITLPTHSPLDEINLPPNEMYLLWPHNTNGFGGPVAINQTEVWWIGFDEVSVGEPFSIYGRNLDLGDDNLCQAYIDGYGWITNTAVNNYKADFICPALPNGTHTLYAHNGHGGKYGWSEGREFLVKDAVGFSDVTNTWINVKDHGAVGDGKTDDYAAFNAAYIAAQSAPFSTIYIPAGDYAIADHMYLGTVNSGLRFKGDGMDASSMFPTADLGGYSFLSSPRDNLYFEDLEISTGAVDQRAAIDLEKSSNTRFTNVRLTSYDSLQGKALFRTLKADTILFKDCELVISYPMFISLSEQVIFDGCVFIGTFDAGSLCGGSIKDLSMFDCTARPHNDSDPSHWKGWAKGRWLVGANPGANNWYFGSNSSTNMRARRPTSRFESAVTSMVMLGDDPSQSDPNWLLMEWGIPDVPAGFEKYTSSMRAALIEGTDPNVGDYVVRSIDPVAKTAKISIQSWRPVPSDTTTTVAAFRDSIDQNSGEQVMFEGGHTEYRGLPVLTTGTTATFSDLSDYLDEAGERRFVMIGDGRGLGQMRQVIDITSETITVDAPWRVQPDSTSVLLIGGYGCKWAIYDNYFDSVPTNAYTASTGFQTYGSSHSMVIDGNIAHETGTGMTAWAPMFDNYDRSKNTVSPQYFLQFKNNIMTSNQNGMLNGISYSNPALGNPDPDFAMLGNVWRNNLIEKSSNEAFTFNAVGAEHFGMTVFDNNVVSNFTTFMEIDGPMNNHVWVNNRFKASGSESGMIYSEGHIPMLHNNVWENFAAKYSGDLPGAILVLPFRVVELSNPTGLNSVPIWNSGTSLLNWSAATTSSWLELTKSSGSVLDENSEDILSFALNANSSAPALGSTAFITVTGGGQTHQITVVYGDSGSDEESSEAWTFYPLPSSTVDCAIFIVDAQSGDEQAVPASGWDFPITNAGGTGVEVKSYLINLFRTDKHGRIKILRENNADWELYLDINAN